MFMYDQVRKICGAAQRSTTGDSELNCRYSQNEEVEKFFKCVMQGNQTTVEEMLENKPELLLEIGYFYDLETRNFEDIDPDIAKLGENGQRYFKGTAFQYAILTLNRSMWMKLQELFKVYYKDEGRAHAQEQAKMFLKHIWKKEDCNAAIHLKLVIKKLKYYIEHHPTWNEQERQHYWSKIVGAAELLLTDVQFNEINDPKRPFFKKTPEGGIITATFLENISERSTKIIYSDDMSLYDDIFKVDIDEEPKRLGIDYALIRGSSPYLFAVCGAVRADAIIFCNGLEELLKARVQERKLLIFCLLSHEANFNDNASASEKEETPRADTDESLRIALLDVAQEHPKIDLSDLEIIKESRSSPRM